MVEVLRVDPAFVAAVMRGDKPDHRLMLTDPVDFLYHYLQLSDMFDYMLAVDAFEMGFRQGPGSHVYIVDHLYPREISDIESDRPWQTMSPAAKV